MHLCCSHKAKTGFLITWLKCAMIDVAQYWHLRGQQSYTIATESFFHKDCAVYFDRICKTKATYKGFLLQIVSCDITFGNMLIHVINS